MVAPTLPLPATRANQVLGNLMGGICSVKAPLTHRFTLCGAMLCGGAMLYGGARRLLIAYRISPVRASSLSLFPKAFSLSAVSP
jgi:hypothetical protein